MFEALKKNNEPKFFFEKKKNIDKEGNTSGTKVELKIQYKNMIEVSE